MSLNIENILFIGSLLLLVSIFAGKTSARFGVPTLLFFILVGMLAGSEGLGKIKFTDSHIAEFIGIAALNFILFTGGFETDWKLTKPIVGQGAALSSLGVLITAGTVGIFVKFITDFNWYEAFLLGAIVSSTDASAVFSILRSKNIGLKHNIRPLLELESGSNDPMAYLLTVTMTTLVLQNGENIDVWHIIIFLLKQIILGASFGMAFGYLNRFIINKIKLDFDGLYPVLAIALMFITFSATNFVGGSGFLAVYIMAVFLGNQQLIHKRTIIKSFDGFAWLMQIVMFLTLGLLVFPSQIIPVIGIGVAISACLILLARPLSVFISMWFFKVRTRSKWFISWVGLRGAVPIVFAIYPLVHHVEKAHMIFNIVFFISLTSVLIQGTTLPFMAKLLKIKIPENLKRKTITDIQLAESVKSQLLEIILLPPSTAIDTAVVNLKFPQNSLITMIHRDGKYITPNGSTVLKHSDRLLILSENHLATEKIYASLGLTVPPNFDEHE